MRVIAGSRRHLPLKSVPGSDTRPTSDQIRETLFNILQNRIYGTRFLDLFAGTGGIGIEALSRGADEAVFVDRSRAACRCIRENLEFTKFIGQAFVYERDAISSLRLLERHEPFDIVYMDPPYGAGMEFDVLAYLRQSEVITDDTLIIAEIGPDVPFEPQTVPGYEISRIKTYRNCRHVFLYRELQSEETGETI